MRTPGVAHTITMAGYSFVQQANGSNFGSMFIILDPFEQAEEPRAARHGDHGPPAAGLGRADQGRAGRSSSARRRFPGLSVAGGFKLMVEDRGGLGLPTLEQQTDDLVAEARKKEPALVGVSTQFRSNTPQLFMDIDRTKVASLGVSLNDVNQTLGIYLGSLYVNSFNAFGRHWQVTLQAEGELSRPRLGHQPARGPQQPGADGAAGHAGQRPRDRRPDLRQPLQPLHGRARSPGTCSRGSAPATSSPQVDKLADQTLPLSMKTEWTELMFMQIRDGQHHDLRLRPGRDVRVPGPGRRSTKAGRCRWR